MEKRQWPIIWTDFRKAVSNDYIELMRALEEVVEDGHFRGENYIQTQDCWIEWGQYKTNKKWHIKLYETNEYHMRVNSPRFGRGKKFETLKEGALWMQNTLEEYKHEARVRLGITTKIEWRREVGELQEELVLIKNQLMRDHDKQIKDLDLEYANKIAQVKNKHK